MRINQYLAKHAGISRRRADEYVSHGRVKINGVIAEHGVQVGEHDSVEYFDTMKWRTISSRNSDTGLDTVVLMYKPVRVLTSHHDPDGRRTVFDLLPKYFSTYKTAGRLDYMSEGLLVLSPNGYLILSLTHPKFKTRKSYIVGVPKPLSQDFLDEAAAGSIVLHGYKLNPVVIRRVTISRYDFLRLDANIYWYEFILTEGRNRQIRNMVTYAGSKVVRLIRVGHGPFTLTKEVVQKGFIQTTLLKEAK